MVTSQNWWQRTLSSTRAAVRLEWHLDRKQIALALGLVMVAVIVLGGTSLLLGSQTAIAGYLTILFLLTIVRVQSWRAKIYSSVWSLAVAMLGYVVGGFGISATLLALLLVSLIQGFVTVGEAELLTRSPMNLIAFASLSQNGGELWHVLVGSAVGIGVILAFSVVSKPTKRERTVAATGRVRLGYGLATAIGSISIVVVSELIGFPYANWALLSYCVMLAVGVEGSHHRALMRILGSILGAILAVLISWMPEPLPIAAAVVCMVLCVAYITAGHYAAFVMFLTPAVLLTTASDHTALQLGYYRLEAVAVATVFALLCNWIVQKYVIRGDAAAAARTAHSPVVDQSL